MFEDKLQGQAVCCRPGCVVSARLCGVSHDCYMKVGDETLNIPASYGTFFSYLEVKGCDGGLSIQVTKNYAFQSK